MSTKATSNIASGWFDLTTLDGIDAGLYDGEELHIIHEKSIVPIAHFSRIQVPLVPQGNVTSAHYALGKTAGFAGNTYFTFTTQDITVKAAEQVNYRIAFAKNLGHNVMKVATFNANDIPLVKFDSVALDALSEANLPAGKYEGYMKMIGNVPKATSFSAHLPPITVKTHLHPLWFCQNGKTEPSRALALCCLKSNTMNFRFEFVKSLTEVIRIQRNHAAVPGTDPDDWQDEDPANVNLATIVDVAGSEGLAMPMPEVWCEYVLIDDDHRRYMVSKSMDVLIEQIQSFTGSGITAGTHRQRFHFSYPMRYLWFGARNVTAADKRNLSNYSTNPDDESSGLDPCRKVTLWYENSPRFQHLGGDVLSDMEYFYHAARVPTTKGHHLITYCYDTASSGEIDGSANYTKISSELEVQINETSTDSDDPATTPSTYNLEIRGVAFNLVRLEGGVLQFPTFEG